MGTKASHHIPEHSLTPVQPMGASTPTVLPMPTTPLPKSAPRSAGRPSEVPPAPSSRRKGR